VGGVGEVQAANTKLKHKPAINALIAGIGTKENPNFFRLTARTMADLIGDIHLVTKWLKGCGIIIKKNK
jgi:hypothetical protein